MHVQMKISLSSPLHGEINISEIAMHFRWSVKATIEEELMVLFRMR